MKSFLMASAAAAVLTIGAAAPAFAACSDEVATLKSQTFTGSVEPTTAPAAQAGATAMPAEGGATASAGPGDLNAPVGANAGETATAAQSGATPGVAPDQKAALNSAGAGATAPTDGSAPPAGTVPGTEATAAMNAVTEGIAASPAEVDQQQTAQPAETAPKPEQMAAAGQPPAPSAAPTSGGELVDMRATLIARADAYQKLGNEGACLNVIEQAKAIQ